MLKIVKKFITTLMCFWLLTTELPINVLYAQESETPTDTDSEIIENGETEGTDNLGTDVLPVDNASEGNDNNNSQLNNGEQNDNEPSTNKEDEVSQEIEVDTSYEENIVTSVLNNNNVTVNTTADLIEALKNGATTINLGADLGIDALNSEITIREDVVINTNGKHLFYPVSVDDSNNVKKIRENVNVAGTVIVYEANLTDALVLFQTNSIVKAGDDINAGIYAFPQNTTIESIIHNEHGVNGQYHEFVVETDSTVVWNEPIKEKDHVVVYGNLNYGGSQIKTSTIDSANIDTYNNQNSLLKVIGTLTITNNLELGVPVIASDEVTGAAGIGYIDATNVVIAEGKTLTIDKDAKVSATTLTGSIKENANDNTILVKIGNNYYAVESLNEALNKVTGGQTLTLFNDVTLNSTVNITKDVNFDLNGHTITEINSASLLTMFSVYNNAKVAFDNGTVQPSGKGRAFEITGNTEYENEEPHNSTLTIKKDCVVNFEGLGAGYPAIMITGNGATLNVYGTLKGIEATESDGNIRTVAIQGNGINGYDSSKKKMLIMEEQ